MNRRLATLLIPLLVSTLVPVRLTVAGDDEPAQGMTNSTPADATGARPPAAPTVEVTEVALGGPRVPERVARTLVVRDAKGGFKRIDGRPEAAALALLDLDPETLERARDAVTDRAVTIGVLLIDHLDQAKAIADAMNGKDRDRASELVSDLWKKLEPDSPRDPLMAGLSQVLSVEQIAETHRLVDEYWDAWVQWELRARKSKERTPEVCAKTEQRLSLELFKDELRRAYEATLKPYREKLDKLYELIDPTPDQREAIVSLVIDYLRTTRTKATVDQRRALLSGIYKALDEDRRAKLFDIVAREVAAGTW
jgi:hypothetical protein